jgi:ankyrin repeat protein
MMHRLMLRLGIGMSMIAASTCGSTPTLPLASAAADNAADLVRTLLRDHDPDEREPDGLTPLMWAARAGALEAMQALLNGGADPNACDADNGWTPLLHAIRKGEIGAVRLLLERGVNPNLAARLLTPLAMAAVDRDPAIVELLLAHGADVHAVGLDGTTALSVAVSGGALGDLGPPLLGGCRPDTVRALLAHDPTLRLPDTVAGRDAIWWARFHGCTDVLKMVG